MQGPSAQKAPAAYGLLLLCVLVAWALCLSGAGVWPFGAETLGPIDNMQQLAPDFGAIPRLLDGRESMAWSYASGGAVRIFLTPFSHNILAPATWLAWLMPWGDVLQTLSWQLLFQLMFSSLACCWYLRRRFPNTPWALQVGLAFSYAFSHFFLTKYLCLNFLNIYALFPLFLAALDALLQRGKVLGYVAAMAVMMAFAGYFAWMFGLFAMVYALAQRRPSRLWGRRGRLALLAGGTLAALALSAVFWLPEVVHMAESSRADAVSLEKLEGAFLYPDEVTLWTLLPLACACLCGVSRQRLKALLLSREGLTAGVLCLCLLFAAATFVWCMGMPVCFMSRFSYMASMMLCCMACRAVGTVPWRLWLCRFAVLMLAMGGMLLVAFRFLRLEPSMLAAACCGFAVAAVLIPILRAVWSRPLCLYPVLVAGTAGVFFCFYNCHRGFVAGLAELRPDRVEHDLRMLSVLADSPMGAAVRVKSLDLALMENGGEYSGVNRFADYLQSATSAQLETMARLGYFDWWTRKMDVGGTVMSDSFLAFRYVAAEKPAWDGLAPCLYAQDGLYVYENPYFWGFGALVDPHDMQPAPEDDRPAGHQRALYRLLAGADAPDFLREDAAPSPDAWAYLDGQGGGAAFEASVIPEMNELGGGPHGRTLLQTRRPGTLPCYVVEPEALQALAQRQRGKVEVLQVVADGMDLCIHPEAGRGMLLLPLLYHRGYTATCNGRELTVTDALGFTGVLLPEGVEEGAVVHLRFAMPCRCEGSGVSVLGLLMTLMLWWRSRRKDTAFARLTGGICLAGGYAAMVCLALWTLCGCVFFLLAHI